VYVDAATEKNFVYLGTSEGSFFVLEFRDTLNTLRICDYKLTLTEFTINDKMFISDIQICPKDERFIACSFQSTEEEGEDYGFVVMYDLLKSKVHRKYKTIGGISSIFWHHSGDFLYAGSANK
jgi:hypothetical protein